MNSPAVTTDNTEGSSHNEIPSLVVPMAESLKLVLPTVSVAEMVPYQPPQTHPKVQENAPSWFLGAVNWRGVIVPMVSYELLNGKEAPAIRSDSQLLVLNNTGVHPHLPFVCLPTQGIPRLSRVAVSEISENTQEPLAQYDQMHVFVAGEQATIPDVSKIEQACVDVVGL